jgi:hypothetical protein
MGRKMTERQDFYVYVYFRLDGSPCYVGKGHGRRWENFTDRRHNKRLSGLIKQSGGILPSVKAREGLTEKEAFETEVALIAVIGRSPYGLLLNMTDGGDGATGAKRTLETRAKMSAWQVGRKMSDQARENMSRVRKGRKRSPSAIAACAASNTGKKRTAETRLKMRLAQLGKVATAAVRATMSATRKGRKLTDYQKNCLAEARRNMWKARDRRMSQEQKRKISATLRQRHQTKASGQMELKL